MKLVDLGKVPEELKCSVSDAKEGVVDALLNLTWQRASGSGPDGETAFGVKPSLRFVSGFLLPRFEETGQVDETSDIHLSTHGLDCQIISNPTGSLRVTVSFAIYVRVLPDWTEILKPELDLFPTPALRKDLEIQIRAEMKVRLAAEKAKEAGKAPTERRPYRDIQQAIYRDLLSQHGVRVASDVVIADAEESVSADGSPSSVSVPRPVDGSDAGGEQDARIAAHQGRYVFDNDQAAQPLDIPQKWQRLSVSPEAFSFDLSAPETLIDQTAAWSQQLLMKIAETVRNWTLSQAGRDWAYRPTSIRPSHFRDENAWQAFLDGLRRTDPEAKEIEPNLSGLVLTVQLDSDLRDPTRQNLRVVLENNSNEVASRRRERFEHAIHQVGLSVELPKQVHAPLNLDRVEASYRFRDFMSYPAIGINCGISEAVTAETIRLSTNWMPRYQQPRIVPNEIANVPTRFDVLGSDNFDPLSLRHIVSAYNDWIEKEKATIDPAVGVDDLEDADRERSKFANDLKSYRDEAQRISLGIELLEFAYKRSKETPNSREAIPYRAWLLLNNTFEESGRVRGIASWRLFQMAFVLAHIPTVVSRMEEYAKSPWFDPTFDEETATLLYFPTGGGKSEAFFGLLVYNLFLDRLRGKLVGVTAMIRYPLRLLTLQQAQRLLAILMRAELLRRKRLVPGQAFEIGFWVGSGNTPNRADDPRLNPVPVFDERKHGSDETASAEYQEVNASFNKTPICPICNENTGLRRMRFQTDEEIGTFCFNKSCEWNVSTGGNPFPFLIVDRDIYRHAPAVLLGVIDKLALIGQHPATINRVLGMFGLARWQERSSGHFVMPSRKMLKDGAQAADCDTLAPAYDGGLEVFHDPFPSLIIQDEAHLLEESLGTFAGLFETLLEQLFVRAGELLEDRVARSPFGTRPIRLPKVVAATATVSVPQQQFGSLYQRRHMHFPYPGTSIYKSFYSAPAIACDPARRGLGHGTARAPEIEAPWMRIYASIMTNGRNHTVTTVSVLAAYHLAVTELWQDLLNPQTCAAAVQRIADSLTPSTSLYPFHSSAIKACGQADPAILPSILDLMRISLTYVTNKKGGDQVIDAFREEVGKVHQRHGRGTLQPYTRLISGGVDVAQIQEIMHEAEGVPAGDDFPDLQQCLRNIVATSAISHGVDVDKFNAMFFAGMPNDIAEFIQASSRVGRKHVGFSLLIPAPHARRDRYIVETHDVFHRFLERMIAPPAITRWAASAHDRVLTSVFQAWLCGWAEQKLFIKQPIKDKEHAPTFETVDDVRRLLTGPALPGAAKDFMDFTVLALGVAGRGVSRLGSAPHPEYYDGRIRNLAKELTDQFRGLYTTTRLDEYWGVGAVGQKPMTSLRDIDEAGKFVLARPFGSPHFRDDDQVVLKRALRIVRRQSGRVSELDGEEEDN